MKNNRMYFMLILFFSFTFYSGINVMAQNNLFGIEKVYPEIFVDIGRNIDSKDIDGDGEPEVVTILKEGLVWYKNEGNGNFSSNNYHLIDNSQNATYSFLELHDINNDNLTDIVVIREVGFFQSEIGVYFNIGNSSFSNFNVISNIDQASASNYFPLIIKDINSDGFKDFIFSKYNSSNLSFSIYYIKYNVIDGFSNEITIYDFDTVENYYQVEVSDINNDSFNDIVLFLGVESPLSQLDTLKILKFINNNGVGNFSLPIVIHEDYGNSFSHANAFYTIKDINGDQWKEILYFRDSSYYSLWGNSLSIYDSTTLIIDSLNSNNYLLGRIVVDDFDSDGDIDILFNKMKVPLSGITNSGLYLNDGIGNFNGIYMAPLLEYLKPIDYNHDGKMDLIYSEGNAYLGNITNINFGIYFFDGISLNKKVIDAAANTCLFFGDFKNDGQTSFITRAASSTRFRNDFQSDGSITRTMISTNNILSNLDRKINKGESKDMNQDGFVDIIDIDNTNHLVWLENISNFDSSVVHLIDTLPGYLLQVNPMNIDNDADIEVMTIDIYYNSSTNHRWSLNIYDKQGPNNWQRNVIDSMFEASYLKTIQTNFFDFDNDNDLDLLAYSFEKINLYVNDGSGNFSSPILINDTSTQSNLFSMDVLDINHDGYLDIVSAEGTNPYPLSALNLGYLKVICTYLNDGSGNFILDTLKFDNLDLTQFGSHYLYLVDLNNDGYSDIITDNYNNNSQIYLNAFDTIYKINQKLLANNGDHPFLDYFHDFDNDGDIDIFAHFNENESNYIIFENYLNDPTISGYTYYDENQNQQKDINEQTLLSIPIQITPNTKANFSNENGYYFFVVDSGDYEVSYNSLPNWQLTNGNQSYDCNVDSSQNFSNLNFGFYPSSFFSETELTLNAGFTRCNSFTKFDYNISNNGTVKENGQLITTIDTSHINNIIFIDQPDFIIDAFTFGWNFYNLSPSHTLKKTVYYQMPEIGVSFSFGDSIQIQSQILVSNTVMNDTIDYINKFNIRCAYDPNDKGVNPNNGGQNYTDFSETLVYTIRFQNTGNDTAFKVLILDTLNENLDFESLKIVSCSHPQNLITSIDENGVVSFLFSNILLPDSGTNYIESQGYITFSIRPKLNLDEGTVISNSAEIYFDFNPAILTNTVFNTMLNLQDSIIEASNYFWQIHPNPSSNYFVISLKEYIEVLFAEIYTFIGCKVLDKEITKETIVETDNWSEGIYNVVLKSEDGKVVGTKKVMVVK